jgi:hypothetical protein
MSASVIDCDRGVEHDLGIHHQRDYCSGAPCLLDIRVAQAGEVLKPFLMEKIR